MPRPSTGSCRHFLPLALWASLLVAVPLRAQTDDPESWTLAVGLLQRGLHAEAAARFEQFLAEHPGDRHAAEAHYRLGVCRLELGDARAAVEPFERALRDRRLALRPECLYRLGGALRELGRDVEAAQRFEALLAEVAADHYLGAAAAFAAGEARQAAGQRSAAIRHFATAAERSSADDPQGYGFAARYRAGHLQLEDGAAAAAAATFRELAERFPQHEGLTEVWFLAGEAAWRAGDAEVATDAWQRAARGGGPFAADALAGLGWAAREAGDPERALQSFQRVVTDHAESPRAVEAGLEVGRIELERARGRAAIGALDAVVARGELPDATRAEALHLRGLAWLGVGDPERARADLVAALAATARGDGARARRAFDLGRAQVAAGDADAALAAYAEASDAPGAGALRGDALYARCVQLHALARHRESLADAERLVRELPDHPLAASAAFAIAENLYALGRYADARGRYDALGPAHPLAATARHKAAWCAFLVGEHADAAARFAACADDETLAAPDREEALSLVAVALLEGGQGDAALAAADRYRARHGRDGRFVARTERIAARVLRARGDLRAAAERLEVAMRVGEPGERGAVGLERADVLFQQGDFAAAQALYRPLAGADGELGSRAIDGLAWCAFELRDDAACRAWIARGVERDCIAAATRAGLRELAVHVEHRAGRFAAAITAAQAFLAEHADSPRAPAVRYALGVAQARAGDAAAARVTLRELVDSGRAERPDLARYELAWACRRDGDEAAAIAAFRALAEAGGDPELVDEAWLHVAEAEQAAGRSEAARAAFAKVRGSARGRALLRRGQTLLHDGDAAGALREFEACVALGAREPLRADALYAVGETALGLGDATACVSALEALLREAPAHRHALRAQLLLGEALARLGRHADAVGRLEAFVAAAASAPADAAITDVELARAQLWCGIAEAARGRQDAAEQAFVAVTRLSQGELAAEAQYRIGVARRARDDLDGAVDAFVKLSILYAHEPWVPRGLGEAGHCYEALGQPDKARRFYGELIERFADSEPARDARARLQALDGAGGR
ncbi:MAG: tetratricopeptide repeat protein [Planctomycetes bacterium]|nr:tetratricopeptide repeat protein [Planctomycetota bacterium]